MSRRPKTEIIRRLRLGNLRTLLRARCGPKLPDDDAGREYLFELLLPVSLGPHANIQMRNTIEYLAEWMGKDEASGLIERINQMPIWERKPSAKVLGERLNLPYGERARLRLRTIGPCDVTEAGMKLLRKQKKRQQDRLRRQRKPRAEYLATHTTNKNKPWLALGISRATHYRHRETSMHHIKLTNSQVHTCLTEQAARPQGVAEPGKGGNAEIKAKTQSKPKSTEEVNASDDATAHELMAHTCLNGLNGNGSAGLRVRVWITELSPQQSSQASMPRIAAGNMTGFQIGEKSNG